MSKQELDAYFVTQLPMLTTIIKGVRYKTNKQYIDVDAAVSEAYLHCIQNLDKITKEKDLQKMMVNFVNKSILWHNSKLSKQSRLNDNGEYNADKADEIDIDLQQKIEIEKWYDEKQAILQMYRNQLHDKVKQIIFDCYFVKDIKKGVDLAKHLGVSKDSGCKYIREMKADIKAFNDNYKNNN